MEVPTCCICYEAIQPPQEQLILDGEPALSWRSQCGHILHGKCALDAFSTEYSRFSHMRCPLCRADIPPQILGPNYKYILHLHYANMTSDRLNGMISRWQDTQTVANFTSERPFHIRLTDALMYIAVAAETCEQAAPGTIQVTPELITLLHQLSLPCATDEAKRNRYEHILMALSTILRDMEVSPNAEQAAEAAAQQPNNPAQRQEMIMLFQDFMNHMQRQVIAPQAQAQAPQLSPDEEEIVAQVENRAQARVRVPRHEIIRILRATDWDIANTIAIIDDA